MILADLYITRDADGQLAGHFRKPERHSDIWVSSRTFDSMLYMDDNDYPDDFYDDLRDDIRNLKFEDEPIKVRVELKIEDIERKNE